MVKKGFTMIEMLLVLLYSCLIVSLLLLSFQNIKKIEVRPSDYSDIILASKQISQEIMQSSVIEINSDSIVYEKDGVEFTIEKRNDRLVKEPGYEIFLFNIDDVIFDYDDLIMMKIVREDEEYEEIIGIYTLEY